MYVCVCAFCKFEPVVVVVVVAVVVVFVVVVVVCACVYSYQVVCKSLWQRDH